MLEAIYGSLSPTWLLLSSFITGMAIFFLGERQVRARSVLNLTGAGIKALLTILMGFGIYQGYRFESRFELLPGLEVVLWADPLAFLFTSLSAFLWLLTTIYAIGYLEGSPNRSRFFGFFSLCVTASIGVALSGNLFTLLIFFELLTLATYPLVVHRGTPEVIRAGRLYLGYTLGGGIVLLIGTVWLQAMAGTTDFTPGGIFQAMGEERPGSLALTALFWTLIVGVGVKAALIPLHGWLPIAMVAPAPVSALLHAVAVVKAGAFGIIRIVHDVFGASLAMDLGVSVILAGWAGLTILFGSLVALGQNEIKKRLAYSTVSQLSYITLGVALLGPVAVVGGMVHLVHQGLMKITMFFCAGNLAETLGIHKVSEVDGVGRTMPWTMGAFTIAALGMIGLPPMAGFISKWYLATGGLEVGHGWVLAVLIASSVLNAGYFLPLVYRAWFRSPPDSDGGPARESATGLWMLLPPILTGAATLMVGLLAAMPGSPLDWSEFIVNSLYMFDLGPVNDNSGVR